MFCSQCGANNTDTAAVCMQFGRSLQAASPPVPLQPAGAFQPGLVQAPPVAVQNYLVFAILATVLCCLPAGIPAIVYAAQVNGKLQMGDVAGAQLASNNAKMWCLISAGLGLGVGVIYGVLVMVGLLSGIHSN